MHSLRAVPVHWGPPLRSRKQPDFRRQGTAIFGDAALATAPPLLLLSLHRTAPSSPAPAGWLPDSSIGTCQRQNGLVASEAGAFSRRLPACPPPNFLHPAVAILCVLLLRATQCKNSSVSCQGESGEERKSNQRAESRKQGGEETTASTAAASTAAHYRHEH